MAQCHSARHHPFSLSHAISSAFQPIQVRHQLISTTATQEINQSSRRLSDLSSVYFLSAFALRFSFHFQPEMTSTFQGWVECFMRQHIRPGRVDTSGPTFSCLRVVIDAVNQMQSCGKVHEKNSGIPSSFLQACAVFLGGHLTVRQTQFLFHRSWSWTWWQFVMRSSIHNQSTRSSNFQSSAYILLGNAQMVEEQAWFKGQLWLSRAIKNEPRGPSWSWSWSPVKC